MLDVFRGPAARKPQIPRLQAANVVITAGRQRESHRIESDSRSRLNVRIRRFVQHMLVVGVAVKWHYGKLTVTAKPYAS